MKSGRLVPRVKLGKKARREQDRERRATWGLNPVTRTTRNKKIYDRKRARQEKFENFPSGS